MTECTTAFIIIECKTNFKSSSYSPLAYIMKCILQWARIPQCTFPGRLMADVATNPNIPGPDGLEHAHNDFESV